MKNELAMAIAEISKRKRGLTQVEAVFAEELMCLMEKSGDGAMLSGRESCIVPTIFVPIGERIRVRGREYECVRAGRVSAPSEACMGCAMRKGRVRCDRFQCSPFDRRDKEFTWFKEV